MKKLALLLCAALVSLSLAACGSGEAPQENKIDGYLETLSYSMDAWMDKEGEYPAVCAMVFYNGL